jgi:hypothetical protein
MNAERQEGLHSDVSRKSTHCGFDRPADLREVASGFIVFTWFCAKLNLRGP